MKAGVEVRVRAARVVADVASRGASLARVLPAVCVDVTDARDVALLRALVFGTLRAHPRLVFFVQEARPSRRRGERCGFEASDPLTSTAYRKSC